MTIFYFSVLQHKTSFLLPDFVEESALGIFVLAFVLLYLQTLLSDNDLLVIDDGRELLGGF